MKVLGISPILNVSDVPASMRWFELLGWQRSFTWNDGGSIEGAADADAHGPAHFGGVCCGELSIFLCRGAQGSRGKPATEAGDEDTGGVWMSWWLESPAAVDAAHAQAVRDGIAVTRPPRDEPWGVRECHIQHPDGHVIRIGAGLDEEPEDCAPA